MIYLSIKSKYVLIDSLSSWLILLIKYSLIFHSSQPHKLKVNPNSLILLEKEIIDYLSSLLWIEDSGGNKPNKSIKLILYGLNLKLISSIIIKKYLIMLIPKINLIKFKNHKSTLKNKLRKKYHKKQHKKPAHINLLYHKYLNKKFLLSLIFKFMIILWQILLKILIMLLILVIVLNSCPHKVLIIFLLSKHYASKRFIIILNLIILLEIKRLYFTTYKITTNWLVRMYLK